MHLDHDFDEIIEEEEAQKREDAPEPCDCCSSRSLDVKHCWLKLHTKGTLNSQNSHLGEFSWETKCTNSLEVFSRGLLWQPVPEAAEMPTVLVMVLPSEEASNRFG